MQTDVDKVLECIVLPMEERGWTAPAGANRKTLIADFVADLGHLSRPALEDAFNAVRKEKGRYRWPSSADFLNAAKTHGGPIFAPNVTDENRQLVADRNANDEALIYVQKWFSENPYVWNEGWFKDAREYVKEIAVRQIMRGEFPSVVIPPHKIAEFRQGAANIQKCGTGNLGAEASKILARIRSGKRANEIQEAAE